MLKKALGRIKSIPIWARVVSAIVAGVLVIVAGLMWFLMGHKYDNWNLFVRAITRKFIVRDLFPSINPIHWTGLVWFWITVGLAVATGLTVYHRRPEQVKVGHWRDEYETRIRRGWDFAGRRRLAVIAIALATLFSSIYTIGSWADNGKDEYTALSSGTTFFVENPDQIPSSLQPLTRGATRNPAGSRSLFTTKHDVPSYVQQGPLVFNWKNRTSALSGAQIVMDRISGTVSGTEIMKETLTYMNDRSSWSAIRNGRGRQPVNGIVYWDGTKTVTCRFTGQYALNYAFGGQWDHNLDDLLAHDYPDLLISHSDMWGACIGSDPDLSKREPVIVIPTIKQRSYGHRTVPDAGDLLVIHGSSSGKPRIERRSSVSAGEFPGPVYAQSLVAKQRELMIWAAGRRNKDADGVNFGYEPINSDVQGDNTSEFLLQDATGRRVWATPLKPSGTPSKVAVAYSVTSADTLNAGSLNEQKVYVLSDGDWRIVNLDDMEAKINDKIREINPGFFGGKNPGEIVELLPVSVDPKRQVVVWQGYAQLNGRVKYRIVFPSDTTKMAPVITDLEPSAPPQGSQTPVCGKQPAQMNNEELVRCNAATGAELGRRLNNK